MNRKTATWSRTITADSETRTLLEEVGTVVAPPFAFCEKVRDGDHITVTIAIEPKGGDDS